MAAVERAVFGNRDGSHQLLESSIPEKSPVLDALRFLVDRPSGNIGPEVMWFPYWGCQPIEHWWALWRGEEDVQAPRRNMVVARVSLVPLDDCGKFEDIDALLAAAGNSASGSSKVDPGLTGAIVDCLARGEGPAVVPNMTVVPHLLRTLWPRLWGSARASLSLRTLFGTEALNSVPVSSIVVIPEELKPRWHGRILMEKGSENPGPAARWFTGNASPRLSRIIMENTARLPGNFAVLKKVERIVDRLELLHESTGTPADALVVVRTLDALMGNLMLPKDDISVLTEALTKRQEISTSDVRTFSLVSLEILPDSSAVEKALALWIEERLATESDADAIWMLEQSNGETHKTWWRRAVMAGVRSACHKKPPEWARAIWRWWQARPEMVLWMAEYLDESTATEEWLCLSTPSSVVDSLLKAVAEVCRKREWSFLLTKALGSTRPLIDCVEMLRSNLSQPEARVDSLLADRNESEVVDAALATQWAPLLDRAVTFTIHNPALLARTQCGDPIPLLSRHLLEKGTFPAELIQENFLYRVFDGALKQDADCLDILKNLDKRAGRFLLDHPMGEELFRINEELKNGAVEEWWHRIITSDEPERPPSSLVIRAIEYARAHASNQPIQLVISLLRLFPEISESKFEAWMNNRGFLWDSGDHEEMASILIERRWRSATRTFRWSWKRELKLVAWYARELLSGFDRFWWMPEDAKKSAREDSILVNRNQVKVLFLAANPLSSTRLALDEEARAINEKVRESKYRDLVVVQTCLAVRPEDLQQALLEHEPTIVHFSGHGGGDVGIVFHAEDQAEERLVAADDLADLFRVLRNGIRIVVLNACYSDVQAQAIVEQVDFVVGMSDTIGDDAARIFAAAFYRGLAFGRSVGDAFDLGINELRLEGLGKSGKIPQLLCRPGVDANLALVSGSAD